MQLLKLNIGDEFVFDGHTYRLAEITKFSYYGYQLCRCKNNNNPLHQIFLAGDTEIRCLKAKLADLVVGKKFVLTGVEYSVVEHCQSIPYVVVVQNSGYFKLYNKNTVVEIKQNQ